MKLKQTILSALLLLTALAAASCDDTNDAPTRETRPDECALPTITIEGQDVMFTEGISAMVDNDVVFKIHVEAEAGLSSLLLNEEEVQKFPYGQLRTDLDYHFIMPDVEQTVLTFAVKDETDRITTLPPITVKAEGRMPAVVHLADFAGERLETQQVPLPMHAAASTQQDKLLSNANIEGLEYVYMRRYFEKTSPNAFTYAQPDPAGGTEKCLKLTKDTKALNLQIRFDKVIPAALIEELLKGTRKLVMDIYVDSDQLPANPDFQLVYANFNKYKNDASGMHQKSPSHWVFTSKDLKRWNEAVFEVTGVGNAGKADFINADEVDMFCIKVTVGDLVGPFYIKHLRIVKSENL